MKCAYLIYNPAAGHFHSTDVVERAARILRNRDWQIKIIKSNSSDHLSQMARQAAEEQMDAFFVVGGDGSINCSLAGLIGTKTSLGILPAGTSNVWGKELGLQGFSWTSVRALEESARRMAQARVCDVDVGRCNDIYFLLWAGIGLDGFIVNHVEPRTRWKKYFPVFQYAVSALRSAILWGGIDLSVIVGGEASQLSGRYLLVVVSNIHLYAGGFTHISPQAVVDDGKMDMWLFEGKNFGDTIKLGMQLLLGRHLQSRGAHRIPVQHVTIKSDSAIYAHLDGEPLVERGSITIEVIPRALRVLIPADACGSLVSEPYQL
jgi:diacylglycerol kinase (ATP)